MYQWILKDKNLIEDIMFRIFDKIAVMTYNLNIKRKYNKKDWDIKYFVIVFVNILFWSKLSYNDLILIRNNFVGTNRYKDKLSFMYNRVRDVDLKKWIHPLKMDIKDASQVRDRLKSIKESKPINVELKTWKFKIGMWIEWILSRFFVAIETAPWLVGWNDKNKDNSYTEMLYIDYIIHMLFFNVVNKWCIDKKWSYKKNILSGINKFMWEDFSNSVEKTNPNKIDKEDLFINSMLWSKSIFFDIADSIYGIKGNLKNEIIYDLLKNNKNIFFN